MKVVLHLSLSQFNLIKKLVSEQLQEDNECLEVLLKRRTDFEEDDDLADSDELKFIRDDIRLLSGTIAMETDLLLNFD